MLNDYECLYITRPSLTEDEVTGVNEKVRSLVEKNGGSITKIENWGKKKLSYEVKKEKKGIYLLTHIKGPGNLVTELENHLKIQDSVIKFLTVKLNLKVEAAKAERAGRLVESQREKALEPISE
ncbi:MAG: 30S ribosomal protein S6 [Nitrospirae bacterium]|nr:30S ribosomal protein S6 [Nitrospirota bacterium]MBI3594447.1 30S ribosomal protein S6 [Nitrospirota bacterium]